MLMNLLIINLTTLFASAGDVAGRSRNRRGDKRLNEFLDSPAHYMPGDCQTLLYYFRCVCFTTPIYLVAELEGEGQTRCQINRKS